MNDGLAIIIVAGGMGSRMQNPVPKQFLPLLGKPVLRWSVDCFAALPLVTELVVVLPAEFHVEGTQVLKDVFTSVPLKIVEGGSRRQDSVANGLKALEPGTEWVGVHDAARPGISPDLVFQAFNLAQEHGNAVVAQESVDTLVEADQDRVVAHLDRTRIFRMQTPQIFPVRILQEALARADAEGWEATDDAGLVKRCGHEVFLAPGSAENLKLTTNEDFAVLEALLRARLDTHDAIHRMQY